MKLPLIISLASAVTGFVIPSEQVLSSWPDKISKLPNWSADLRLPNTDDNFGEWDNALSYAMTVAGNIHTQSEQTASDILDFGSWPNIDKATADGPENDLPPEEAHIQPRSGWWPHPKPDDPDHDTPNKTIYELISESEHSTKFAKLVSKFDDVVEYLNSTSADYTAFVPVDNAFEKFKDVPHPPDEYLKKLIAYHVSPDFAPVRTVFISRTIPTLLKEKELDSYPSRISTQFGLHGLTLNFISHIVKADIVSKPYPALRMPFSNCFN